MKTPTTGPGLLRSLGPMMAIAVVVGTVIGSGVFKKPAIIAENVAFSGLTALVWIGGGLLALLGALAYAEVAVLLPRAGGNYVFLREGYGRLFGFLWGWVEFGVIRSASIAALATVFSESFADVLSVWCPMTFWQKQFLTMGVVAGLALVNARGTNWGGGLQLFVTIVKIGTLLVIAALPFIALWWARPAEPTALPDTGRLEPVWPAQWELGVVGGIGTAFLGVLWAYHGWMNVAPVAEEIKQPQRNLPLALIGGVGIVMFLYLAANLAYALVIPRSEMAGLKNTTVVAEFGRRLLGPVGGAFASAAVMCSVFGALNGNLLVGPRLLYAMGKDGLAPASLQAVHPRYHTPARAIGVLAAWAVLQVLVVAILMSSGLLTKEPFDILTDFAMFGSVVFETLAVMTIFVFRARWPDAPRPYRCLGYPVVPALYVLLPAFILTTMVIKQWKEVAVAVGYIGIGLGLYFLLELYRTGTQASQSPQIGSPPVFFQPSPTQTPIQYQESDPTKLTTRSGGDIT